MFLDVFDCRPKGGYGGLVGFELKGGAGGGEEFIEA